MREEDPIKILETVRGMTVDIADLFAVILNSGYGASYRKLQWELAKRRRNRDKDLLEKQVEKKLKQRYYEMLYRLKKDKLIREEVIGSKKLLAITQRGKDKLLFLRRRLRARLPEIAYQKEVDNKFTIIAFDIPEKEKRKREWLRAALKNLSLKMVQKSVWAGKVKIPKRFLDDLAKLGLLDFVEIFEISKAGSLKHIA